MMSFIQLSDSVRSFLTALWSVIAMLSMLLFAVRFRRTKRLEPISLISALLLTVWLVFIMTAHRSEMNNAVADGLTVWAGSVPYVVYIFIMLLSVFFCGTALKKETELYRNVISAEIIREAIDDMSDGLGFFETDGFPVLVNHHMYELALELTGNHLQNGTFFWQSLSENPQISPKKRLQGGSNPVFICADGGVRSFSRAVLEIEDKSYIQITATDVTKKYQLSTVLKENNELLHKQQKRLRSLLENIVQMKHEEELLASKVRVHAQLGQCVLAAGHVLAQDCTDEKSESAVQHWKSVIETMRTGLCDEDCDTENTKAQLEEAAAAMGCKIEFSGDLPHDSDAAYLILSAVREAVTNAVRHAGADTVTVELTQTDTEYCTVIYDNGRKKAVSVSEGGGLGGLREKIERAGGRLDVKCENGVRLYIRLLKQKERIM